MATCRNCHYRFAVMDDEDDGQHGCPSCGYGDCCDRCGSPNCEDLECADPDECEPDPEVDEDTETEVVS